MIVFTDNEENLRIYEREIQKLNVIRRGLRLTLIKLNICRKSEDN